LVSGLLSTVGPTAGERWRSAAPHKGGRPGSTPGARDPSRLMSYAKAIIEGAPGRRSNAAEANFVHNGWLVETPTRGPRG
jgi:hypothetical protein